MWPELLTIILGMAFGFFHKGKEDYWGILRNAAVMGIVIGVLFLLISVYVAPGSMSIDLGFLGALGFILIIVIFVIIFIAGAFIGDRIERVRKK